MKKKSFHSLQIIAALIFSTSLAWAGSLSKTVYDFDDTLISTTAYSLIYPVDFKPDPKDPENGAKKISTADWAEVRHALGQEGPYKNWKLDKAVTFSNFSGTPGTNAFLGHIKETLKTRKTTEWKSPMWEDFVEQLKDPESAEDVYILTARSSTAAQVLEGFQHLRSENLIDHLPPAENIFAVSDKALRLKSAPDLVLAEQSSEVSKALVMKEMLNELEKEALKTPGSIAMWAFYDDDYANFAKARDTLVPLAATQWPHVRITIGYVGNRRPNTPAHEVVVQPAALMPRMQKAAGF